MRTGGRMVVWGSALAGVVAFLTGCVLPERPLSEQLRSAAAVLRTVDPAAPLDDLAPVATAIGDAQVVGLGESVHGAAEEVRLKHRVLRLSRLPPAATSWLTGPVRTRGLPDHGPGSLIDGGSLHEWFDVLVHCRRTTPAAPPR